MRKNARQRMIVDARLQFRLIARVAAYWFFSLVAVALILLSWQIAQGPFGPFLDPARYNELWYNYLAMALASLLFLPVLLADTVLISNRFAGPLDRVRRQMRALAEGQKVERIEFRKRDAWAGLANDFNAVVDAFERLRVDDGGERQAKISLPRREPDAVPACPVSSCEPVAG